LIAILVGVGVVLVLSRGHAARAEEAAGPIRFVPEAADAFVKVDAHFVPNPKVCAARQTPNLHAGYPGTVEVGRRADGRLYLVTELTFDRYLKGIAEVPRDWPGEALKAQVVAARTYAEAHMNPSTALAKELKFNLCSTDACQVYRGLGVERGAWGEEWSKAVEETSGEILEWEGRPASTFFFSTSNGHTYSNSDVFGGSPLPYLKPVTETDDTASPVRTWTVRMPLTDVAQTLRDAGSWGAAPIDAIKQDGNNVIVSGGGKNTPISLSDFRIRLNNHAVCLTPKRYPTAGANGKMLLQVVPSNWYTVRQEAAAAVMEGAGWGHGVGMVQWGLKGKADRGMTHADMLAFYYGGLHPVKKPEPGAIRIGLAIDIDEMTIEPSSGIRIEGATPPPGPIHFKSGPAITFEKGSPIIPVLQLRNPTSTAPSTPGAPATFSFELSSPANIHLKFKGPTGDATTSIAPHDRGPQTLTWDAAATLPPGTYETTLIANDGVDEVTSPPMTVTVVAPSPLPSPTPFPSKASPKPIAQPKTSLSSKLSLAIGALLLIAATAALLLKRHHPSPH
jgi:SpoIID/LytB domain protein